MQLKSKDGMVDFPNAEEIGHGFFATVFKKDDIVIKKYRDDLLSASNLIDVDMFYDLQGISSEAFIDLKDIYVFDKEYETTSVEIPSGYTSGYIETIDKKCIDLPMYYSLNSLKMIREFIDELNKKKISIFDNNHKNVIPSKNGLVIIDPDLYSYGKDVEDYNNTESIYYLIDLWCHEFGIEDFYYKMIVSEYVEKRLNGTIQCDDLTDKLPEETPRELLKKILKIG